MLRRCLCVLLVLAEPCLHLLGVPHPEGLTSLALTHVANNGH
jgi:hypothetical protein